MAPQITDERNDWTQCLPARAMSVQHSPQRKAGQLTRLFWLWVLNLGALAMVVIAIIVAALAYLVYKKSKKGSAK